MSNWDEWETDDVMTLYDMVDAAYDAKKTHEDVIDEIKSLARFKSILSKISVSKIQSLQKMLVDIVASRHKTKDTVENQDKA